MLKEHLTLFKDHEDEISIVRLRDGSLSILLENDNEFWEYPIEADRMELIHLVSK